MPFKSSSLLIVIIINSSIDRGLCLENALLENKLLFRVSCVQEIIIKEIVLIGKQVLMNPFNWKLVICLINYSYRLLFNVPDIFMHFRILSEQIGPFNFL